MSQENVDKVREGYAAFARGDVAYLLEQMDEDVVFQPAIAPLFGLDEIRGKEAVKRFLAVDLAAGFTDFAAEALSIEDRDEFVLVHTRSSAVGTASGAPVVLETFGFYKFREGKAVEFRDYNTREEALKAAGLSE